MKKPPSESSSQGDRKHPIETTSLVSTPSDSHSTKLNTIASKSKTCDSDTATAANITSDCSQQNTYSKPARIISITPVAISSNANVVHPTHNSSPALKRNYSHLPAITTTNTDTTITTTAARPSSTRSRRSANYTHRDSDRSVTDDSLALSSTGKHSPALAPLMSTTTSTVPLSPSAALPDLYSHTKKLPSIAGVDSRSPTKTPNRSEKLAADGQAQPPLNLPMSTNTRLRLHGPASITKLMMLISGLGLAILVTILYSTTTRQLDAKGCRMSFMRPGYFKFDDFDTEHTRFATKYSLYLYREGLIDDQNRAILKGTPVIFIPGNAGSYKQVRPIAAEAATYYNDVIANDEDAAKRGIRPLDIFTVDFNEDFTAFHGQTLLDQAEYLNEAIRFILSLYMDPSLNARDKELPDPTSVIILGHSMGGVVARTMLLRPNYQYNSINTILTMAAPHSQPPVSFDGNIVSVYDDMNAYWRWAYSQKWAIDNPLWHVTLVSVAGGSLDTVVPSDYSSIETLVPETHGFTVFTTGIPTVWTSMDHQAILWCDQFRKVVTKALYEVVDVHRASQTKPRAERMRVFRKWFLTGMEHDAEKQAPSREPTTLLTIGDNSTFISSPEERLVVRNLGTTSEPRAWLLPVPTHLSARGSRFNFMTDAKLDSPGEHGKLEVFLCSVHPIQPGHTGPIFTWTIDLSGGAQGSTRLACRSATPDVVLLPASTKDLHQPFYLDYDNAQPMFSYLEYYLDALSEHQFIAVVDKASSPSRNLVLAEFTDDSKSIRIKDVSIGRLAMFGVTAYLPATRPMVSEIKIPAIYSGLLAFRAEITGPKCGKQEHDPLFAPLVRQYTTQPYESKFHVNAHKMDIHLHGQSPYVSSLTSRSPVAAGLSLQLWVDPTCASHVRVDIQLDVLGSLGQMYMRYRTVFAAVPLAIVALTMMCQFSIYNDTGEFVTFLQALDMCFRSRLPWLLATCFGLLWLFHGDEAPAIMSSDSSAWQSHNGTLAPMLSSNRIDLLIGTSDLFFWYLIPLIGVICIGVCVALHYVTLLLTRLLNLAYMRVVTTLPLFPTEVPPRSRLAVTAVSLFLVWTFIPYQFAYLVACIVQLSTTVRALRQASESTPSPTGSSSANFHNYCHTILLLMLWVLPINLPVFVVWARNLMVHYWLTPFSSNHNMLSVVGFVLLVEQLRTMAMIPRATNPQRNNLQRIITGLLFAGTGIFAAVYGVSYAYLLHYLVNIICLWLVVVTYFSDSVPLSNMAAAFDSGVGSGIGSCGGGNASGSRSGSRKRGKTP
ncbi:GPI inositol-deacylase [Ceratocystis fimbriata CBS 114723]|uniref:GPI inositol-deacylase n=1 Tax=Ceratocystis fimbriata CBS 114723 TaxID=1035309 RepID=A0A2C5XFR5_9PEZI|nr:GPI inositol-deacylase [Ceratocystis fimbriata CBS 114723]